MRESLIKGIIEEHLESLDLMKDREHRFTKGGSCLKFLIGYFEQVTTSTNRERHEHNLPGF